jgi:hypothetical protein
VTEEQVFNVLTSILNEKMVGEQDFAAIFIEELSEDELRYALSRLADCYVSRVLKGVGVEEALQSAVELSHETYGATHAVTVTISVVAALVEQILS